MAGIAAYGGYVPRLRLQRKAMVDANSWFNPGLRAHGRGERSICNWDEDTLTMAVAAARDCLADSDRDAIDTVHLASTTLPFGDRQNATVLGTALSLSDSVAALDFTSSQRAGTSSLVAALKTMSGTNGAGQANALVVASEHRRAKTASPQELLFGDGAAALLLTGGDGIARLLGTQSISDDFVDHYRGENEKYDYQWEERWIRDEGWMKIVPRALDKLFEDTGISGKDIDHLIVPTIFPQVIKGLAKRHEFSEKAVRDTLQGVMGDAGSAHALVMLVHTLQSSKPGDKILVIGFGQGADALLFEVTDAIKKLDPRLGISGHLARRRAEENYNKYLAFNDLVTQEKGIRSEVDRQTALTALYRNKKMLTGLVGGKCTKCGTLQFPKTNICVSPNCGAVKSQEDHPFADTPSNVITWSADWLTYTADPPAHYGMVQFKDGGRLLADFTDVDVGSIDVGTPMQMVFRVKEFDKNRGFRKYFWKAAPVVQETA